MEKEYHFEGNVYTFLGIMKWSLVARQMHKDNREDFYETVSNPDKVEAVAKKYGMTDMVLMKELIRLADNAKDVLNLYEAIENSSKKE